MGGIFNVGSGLGKVTMGLGGAATKIAGDATGEAMKNLTDPIMGLLNSGQGQIVDAATLQQANEQYGNVQSGLAQQQAFLNALKAQGGVQNQSDVYNQLAGVASGQGPNPAQAMLNQSTGSNIASQAALMAGQRGASSNPALIARMAAQQGGNLQQQAAGQGATMQANQSLNALGQMGNIAGQQVSQQGNATTGYNQMAQGAQANILNAIGGQNAQHAALAKASMDAQAKMIGQIAGAAGSAAGMARGGEVRQIYAEGGAISPAAQFLKNNVMIQPAVDYGPSAFEVPNKQDAAENVPAKKAMADGGMVPVKLSPGEVYLPPEKAQQVVRGQADPIKDGKKVPGKAKVKGDSLENDTYSTSLEEGGIVIPRSIINSKDPHKAAADFVAAHLSKMRK